MTFSDPTNDAAEIDDRARANHDAVSERAGQARAGVSERINRLRESIAPPSEAPIHSDEPLPSDE